MNENTIFGTNSISYGVKYCKKCHNIIDFPFTKILANARQVEELKKVGFHIFERKSWSEEGRICGGGGEAMITKRESMNSCMNCCNARGYDCDEPWTENTCSLLHVWDIAPFSICDLHGIKLDRIDFQDDGSVFGKRFTDKNYRRVLD